jgi:hypothetical protein
MRGQVKSLGSSKSLDKVIPIEKEEFCFIIV